MRTSARFDAGYGSAYFAKQVGQKAAREIFFLAQEYDAQRAYELGAVNAVVPHAELETTAMRWAETILGKSPTAIRMLKFAMNAVDDGLVGQQVFAGEATRLAYGTDEAAEGRDAFLEKRDPDWSPVPLAVLSHPRGSSSAAGGGAYRDRTCRSVVSRYACRCAARYSTSGISAVELALPT